MKTKKYIKIEGTYGDPVKLYLDGYISTKYGDFHKVKTVDIENKTVECYGDSFDFSRVSSSCKNSIEAKKEYINILKQKFKTLNLKLDTVFSININDVEYYGKISFISYPDNDNEYFPKIFYLNKENISSVLLINDFDLFYKNLKIISYIETLDDKLNKVLSKYSISYTKKNNIKKDLVSLIEDLTK